MKTTLATLFTATLLLAGCDERATQPVESGYGKHPTLVAPHKTLLPTVNIAEAQGWLPGKTPVAASGLAVREFAGGLDHPRMIHVLPNGDVLVAETNAPPKPDDAKGIRGWFEKKIMARAGAATPSANRITLLRDADGDGVAETRTVFLEGLNSPFGMALIGHDFYVANSDAVVRFPYQDGETSITAPGTRIIDLPAGTINHHWTKDLTAGPPQSKDGGTLLYASVGSNSNAAENGFPAEEGRAAIWEIDPKTGAHRIFASGLRNPNGLCWEPSSGVLWVAVNERDELGSDLVPDYMTSVKDGGFYGWPFSWFGQHVDDRVTPPNPELAAKAIVPDYALGAHTASLGLAFSKGAQQLPSQFAEGVFVGQHGSWNRRPRSGYKVIFVPFANGQPSGAPFDVLTGFLSDDEKAQGRPVGVAIDGRGALLVADDVGNKIWRVTGATRPGPAK